MLGAAAILAAAGAASAQEIYRWQDDKGRAYYSDSPRASNDKPVILPDVSKENLDRKIEQIKADTPRNCEQHGGVDCGKGPDIDGSVVCLDGYRAAVLPFRFRCMESRLQADFAVLLESDESLAVTRRAPLSKALHGRKPSVLALTLRNLTGVEAFGLKIWFVMPGFPEKKLPAVGPDKVAPYGLAEYLLTIDDADLPQYERQWDEVTYKVDCINCAGVLSRPD